MQINTVATGLALSAAFLAGCDNNKESAAPPVRADITFDLRADRSLSDGDAINAISAQGQNGRGVYWVINTATKQGHLVISGTDDRRSEGASQPATIKPPPAPGKLLVVPVPNAGYLLGKITASVQSANDTQDFLRNQLPTRPGAPAQDKPWVTIQVRSTGADVLPTDFSRLNLNRLHLVQLPLQTVKASEDAACYGELTTAPVITSFNCMGLRKDQTDTSNPAYQGALQNIRDQHRPCTVLLCEIKPQKISAAPQVDMLPLLEQHLKLYAFLGDSIKTVAADPLPQPQVPARL